MSSVGPEQEPTLFSAGMTVELVEGEEVIDRLEVASVFEQRYLRVKSLDMFPGDIREFGAFPENDEVRWRMLFLDPMTDERCFSQRAPSYLIRTVAPGED